MPRTTQSTNAMLGYPPDARLLIMNIDDFGMCHSINEATIRAIKEGLATSCSIMAPCPWSLHGLHLLQENPDITFGVHLTVVSEAPYYRWSSITPSHKVSSLIDEDGYFYAEHRVNKLLERADLAELETEFRVQIEFILSSGLKSTHLDSHYSIHTRREDIFDLTFGLAREYGLAMRVGRKQLIEKLQQQGYPTDDHDFLDSYLLETSDKLSSYLTLLRKLPAGLTEWGVHPAIANAELKAVMPTWDVREADFHFLMSQEAHDVVSEEGIIIIDHCPLQELWRGK